MPGTDHTTVGLLSEIRRRGRIPTLASDFSDSELLLIADTCLRETFVPLLMRARSDYYLRSADITLVANQAVYGVPARAVLNAIRKVEWIDSASNEMELFPLPATDVSLYSAQTGTPLHYALRDDVLVLCPTPSSALGTLRVWYEYRPSKLVSSGYFTVASTTSTTVTLTGSVTWTAASRYDFVKADAPFSLLGVEANPDSTGTGLTLTFPAADIPSRLEADDFMCLPGESPVPQLPAELHSSLALAAAVECMWEYAPDEAALQDQRLQRALASWEGLLAPRTRGRQIKQVNRNSAIRRRGSYRRSGNWEP
jgi:hypothetical protein